MSKNIVNVCVFNQIYRSDNDRKVKTNGHVTKITYNSIIYSFIKKIKNSFRFQIASVVKHDKFMPLCFKIIQKICEKVLCC